MTPYEKVQALIIDWAMRNSEYPAQPITDENVEELWDDLNMTDYHWDARSETRVGTVETGLDCPSSRHYECKAVAAKALDGSWVGWPYWYGGGKHGEPEAIDWMGDAYDLDCVEEQKMVTVQTFTKKPE